jgi:hypothetical protein
VRRLKDYILEYNSNVDAGSPKTQKQIIEKILNQEKEKQASTLKLARRTKTAPIHDELIAEVREREQKRKREEHKEPTQSSPNKKLREYSPLSPFSIDDDEIEQFCNATPQQLITKKKTTITTVTTTEEEEIIELSPQF